MGRPKKEDTGDKAEDQKPTLFTQILDIIAANKYENYSVICGDDLDAYQDEKISTGSARFDALIGGGFRPGMSLFFGDEEAGKTAQGLVWAKNWLNKYGDKAMFVYFDAEGRGTKFKMEMSGIDNSRMIWIRGNIIEDTFDTIDKLVCNNKEGKRYFFLLDSVDALIRKEDKKKSFSEAAKVAGGATVQSQAGRKLSNPIHACGHHLYMISQIRSQNVMGGAKESAKPSGGKAPKFYADIIGKFTKPWSELLIKDGEKIVGHLARLKLTKSYNETTNIEIDIPIKLGHVGGVWREYEAFLMSREWGFIEANGSWFNFSELFQKFVAAEAPDLKEIAEKKVQGETNLIRFFEANIPLVEYMEAKVKAMSA